MSHPSLGVLRALPVVQPAQSGGCRAINAYHLKACMMPNAVRGVATFCTPSPHANPAQLGLLLRHVTTTRPLRQGLCMPERQVDWLVRHVAETRTLSAGQLPCFHPPRREGRLSTVRNVSTVPMLSDTCGFCLQSRGHPKTGSWTKVARARALTAEVARIMGAWSVVSPGAPVATCVRAAVELQRTATDGHGHPTSVTLTVTLTPDASFAALHLPNHPGDQTVLIAGPGFPPFDHPGFKIGKFNHLAGEGRPGSVGSRVINAADETALREAVFQYFPLAGETCPLARPSLMNIKWSTLRGACDSMCIWPHALERTAVIALSTTVPKSSTGV